MPTAEIRPVERAVAYVQREGREPSFLATTTSSPAVHLGAMWALPATDVHAADRVTPVLGPKEPERVAALRGLFAVGGPLVVSATVRLDASELEAMRVLAGKEPEGFASRLRDLGLRLDTRRTRVLARTRASGDVLRGDEAVVIVEADPFQSRHPGLEWITRTQALEGWRAGTFLPAPHLSVILRALCHAPTALADLEMSHWELAPAFAMMPVRTPTLPPATHTNAFFVGNGEFVLVEPATPYPEELERIEAWVREMKLCGLRIQAILCTHHHPDHVGGAMQLRERLGAPLCAHRATAERLAGEVVFDRLLEDGDRIVLDGPDKVVLRAVHTPGHAPGHLCFLEERSGAMIAGDMVAGVGTILVETHDGDMALYLESLRKMKDLGPTMLLPAHGGVVRDPAALLDFYVQHRLMREGKVADALARVARPASLEDLVAVAYDDTPEHVWPIAMRSLEAHLVKLEREHRARRSGPLWSLG
ncbi:MAG: MBL fold metallo-hydrolase [Polyangiales bacterium]